MQNDNKTKSIEYDEIRYLKDESERRENIERAIYEDRRIEFRTLKRPLPLIPKNK